MASGRWADSDHLPRGRAHSLKRSVCPKVQGDRVAVGHLSLERGRETWGGGIPRGQVGNCRHKASEVAWQSEEWPWRVSAVMAAHGCGGDRLPAQPEAARWVPQSPRKGMGGAVRGTRPARGSRGLHGLLEEGHYGPGAMLATDVEAGVCVIWTLPRSGERGGLPAARGGVSPRQVRASLPTWDRDGVTGPRVPMLLCRVGSSGQTWRQWGRGDLPVRHSRTRPRPGRGARACGVVVDDYFTRFIAGLVGSRCVRACVLG